MSKLPAFRFWRTFLPAAALAGAVFLFAKFSYPLPAVTELLLWYSRLDPLLLIGQLRAGTLAAWMLAPLVILAATLLFGRVFCGWLCPLGGLLALLQSLKGSGGSPPPGLTKLNGWRFPWLAFLLVILLLGSAWP